jgi:hypothetical protein
MRHSHNAILLICTKLHRSGTQIYPNVQLHVRKMIMKLNDIRFSENENDRYRKITYQDNDGAFSLYRLIGTIGGTQATVIMHCRSEKKRCASKRSNKD